MATQMKSIRYVCTSSSRTIIARLDSDALWMEIGQAAHLFGIKSGQATKLLRQIRTTGEIDAENDLRSFGAGSVLLSHRAVVALGYQRNFGRATAFRNCCASHLPAFSVPEPTRSSCGCAICCAIACRACVPTFSRERSSNSGTMTRRPGPASSSIRGAPR